jgi:molybdopterin/thiamine biosynthesis adenylyltransferase
MIMSANPTGKRVKPFSLIINQREFIDAVRPVLIQARRVATCRIRRRETTSSIELLMNDWSATDAFPSGQALPPMSDLGLVMIANDDETPERMIERTRPKRSQTVVGVCLRSSDFRHLPVAIFDQGEWVRPESVRFIGSGLLTLPESTPMPPSVRESRTWGPLRSEFDRMTSLWVTLVGVGRGGQELARQLVSIGLRRLTLIDGDRIGPENLDAMPMAGEKDVNELKVFQLARALRRNQPELTISCVPKSILDPVAIRAVRETRSDAIMSFVDSDAARLAVARLCQESETIHLDVGTLIRRTPAGIRRMSADVRLFEPRRGCVACCPPMERIDDALYDLAAPEGVLRRGRPTSWNELRAGSLLHLNAAACGLAVEMWLGWLSGSFTTSRWARMFWDEYALPEFEAGPVGPSQQCSFCNTNER